MGEVSSCRRCPKRLQIMTLFALANIMVLLLIMNTVEFHTLVYLVNPLSAFNRNDTPHLVPMKRILYYTTYYEVKDFYFGFGHEPFVKFNCSVSNCETTDNRSLIGSSDAVVFHIRNLPKVFPYHDLQQRWIFFLMESPVHTFSDYTFNATFNWTMTYRLDSDILSPYATFVEKSAEEKVQSAKSLSKNNAFGRTKMVSWLVSHCNASSQREDLVKEMAKHIEVHIYGRCGIPCDKHCAEKLNKEYKFFLAFENSLCKDYVTEKFFRIAEEDIGIPVVYGGGNYSRIAPPRSYIDARSFKTPKDLANYLLAVAGDDKLYNEYFEWRSHFRLAKWAPFCDLCKLLHEDLPPKTYPDIRHWWDSLGRCEAGYRNQTNSNSQVKS